MRFFHEQHFSKNTNIGNNYFLNSQISLSALWCWAQYGINFINLKKKEEKKLKAKYAPRFCHISMAWKCDDLHKIGVLIKNGHGKTGKRARVEEKVSLQTIEMEEQKEPFS